MGLWSVMKHAALILLALPVSAVGMTIEAREMVTTNREPPHWQYGSGWHGVSETQGPTKAIQVVITDLTRRCPSMRLYAFFVAVGQSDHQRFVHDFAVLDINFNGRMQVRDEVQASPASLSQCHYPDASSRTRYMYSGNPEGWIVVGRNESGIVGTAASNPALLQVANSEVALRQLVGTSADRDKIDLFRSLNAGAAEALPNKQPTPSSTKITAGTASESATAVPSAASHNLQFATLTVPVEVEVAFGKITLPRGTTLKVLSRTGNNITALYFDQTVAVPVSSTDLK